MEAPPLPAVPKLTSRTIEALAAEATSRQIIAENAAAKMAAADDERCASLRLLAMQQGKTHGPPSCVRFFFYLRARRKGPR